MAPPPLDETVALPAPPAAAPIPLPIPVHISLPPPIDNTHHPPTGSAYSSVTPSDRSVFRRKLQRYRNWAVGVAKEEAGAAPAPAPAAANAGSDLDSNGPREMGKDVGVGSATWDSRSTLKTDTGTEPTIMVEQRRQPRESLRPPLTGIVGQSRVQQRQQHQPQRQEPSTSKSKPSASMTVLAPSTKEQSQHPPTSSPHAPPPSVRSPPVPFLAHPPPPPAPASTPTTKPAPAAPGVLLQPLPPVVSTRAQREAYFSSALDLPLDLLQQTGPAHLAVSAIASPGPSNASSKLTNGRLASLLGRSPSNGPIARLRGVGEENGPKSPGQGHGQAKSHGRSASATVTSRIPSATVKERTGPAARSNGAAGLSRSHTAGPTVGRTHSRKPIDGVFPSVVVGPEATQRARPPRIAGTDATINAAAAKPLPSVTPTNHEPNQTSQPHQQPHHRSHQQEQLLQLPQQEQIRSLGTQGSHRSHRSPTRQRPDEPPQGAVRALGSHTSQRTQATRPKLPRGEDTVWTHLNVPATDAPVDGVRSLGSHNSHRSQSQRVKPAPMGPPVSQARVQQPIPQTRLEPVPVLQNQNTQFPMPMTTESAVPPSHRQHLPPPRPALSRSQSSGDGLGRKHRYPPSVNLTARFEPTMYPLPDSGATASNALMSPVDPVAPPVTVSVNMLEWLKLMRVQPVSAKLDQARALGSEGSKRRYNVNVGGNTFVYASGSQVNLSATPVQTISPDIPLVPPASIEPLSQPATPHTKSFGQADPAGPPLASPVQLQRHATAPTRSINTVDDGDHVSFDVPSGTTGRLHVSLAWFRDRDGHRTDRRPRNSNRQTPSDLLPRSPSSTRPPTPPSKSPPSPVGRIRETLAPRPAQHHDPSLEQQKEYERPTARDKAAYEHMPHSPPLVRSPPPGMYHPWANGTLPPYAAAASSPAVFQIQPPQIPFAYPQPRQVAFATPWARTVMPGVVGINGLGPSRAGAGAGYQSHPQHHQPQSHHPPPSPPRPLSIDPPSSRGSPPTGPVTLPIVGQGYGPSMFGMDNQGGMGVHSTQNLLGHNYPQPWGVYNQQGQGNMWKRLFGRRDNYQGQGYNQNYKNGDSDDSTIRAWQQRVPPGRAPTNVPNRSRMPWFGPRDPRDMDPRNGGPRDGPRDGVGPWDTEQRYREDRPGTTFGRMFSRRRNDEPYYGSRLPQQQRYSPSTAPLPSTRFGGGFGGGGGGFGWSGWGRGRNADPGRQMYGSDPRRMDIRQWSKEERRREKAARRDQRDRSRSERGGGVGAPSTVMNGGMGGMGNGFVWPGNDGFGGFLGFGLRSRREERPRPQRGRNQGMVKDWVRMFGTNNGKSGQRGPVPTRNTGQRMQGGVATAAAAGGDGTGRKLSRRRWKDRLPR